MNDLICIAGILVFLGVMIGIFVGIDKIMNRHYKKKKVKLRAAYTKFFSVYDAWHEQHSLSSKNHEERYDLEAQIDRLIKENQYLPADSDLFVNNCSIIMDLRDGILQLMLQDKIIQFEIKALAHQMNNMDRPKDYQGEYH